MSTFGKSFFVHKNVILYITEHTHTYCIMIKNFMEKNSGKENRMKKKIIAIIAALTLSASILSSCGNSDSSSQADTISGTESSAGSESTAESKSDDSTAESAASGENGSGAAADDSSKAPLPEPSLTINGEKVDTSGITMCTVDGDDIDFDMFRYYYFYVMNNMGLTADALASDEEAFKSLKENIIQQFKRDYTTVHLAKENNLTLDDENKKNIEDKITNIKSQYADEAAFQDALKGSYLTEAVYRRMLEIAELYTKVESTLLTNEGKYATKKDDFKKIVKDNDKYARVIHILVPYYSQAELTDEDAKSSYENMSLSEKTSAKQIAYNALSDEEKEKVKESAKKVAEEVLKKAKDGEDFSKLITEYGWDPGMETSPDGYYITKNTSLVQEFKDASFALKENEISDLVENTSYGWFIIKRLPVDMDYVEEHIANMILEYDTPTINEMFNKLIEELEVNESDYFKNLKPDSIT